MSSPTMCVVQHIFTELLVRTHMGFFFIRFSVGACYIFRLILHSDFSNILTSALK
jgi:hypothetical protein